jgi:hypothetical protein
MTNGTCPKKVLARLDEVNYERAKDRDFSFLSVNALVSESLSVPVWVLMGC